MKSIDLKAKPMILGDTTIGTLFEIGDFLFFTGNRFGSLDLLKQSFPEFLFPELKQVHGPVVLEQAARSVLIQKEAPQADAHVTVDSHVALKIITADCIPVLLACPESGIVGSAHAGWRGLVTKIIPETVKKMVGLGAQPDSIIAVIGPHIRIQNFEVHNDVADQLAQSAVDKNVVIQIHEDSEKKRVDLAEIALQQMTDVGVFRSNVADSASCTFEGLNFASYRRDGPKSGRQISFVVRRKV